MGRQVGVGGVVQRIVAEVFARCMANDIRALPEIVQHVDLALVRAGVLQLPTPYMLQVMVSRVASRPAEGFAPGSAAWAYYPAYSHPPRYVSRARVRELAARAEAGTATPTERARLLAMLEDLRRGVRHWVARHEVARRHAQDLQILTDDASLRAFPLESFTGRVAPAEVGA